MVLFRSITVGDVRDDMSKGLKIMSLGVINHGMSLSVLYMIYKS
jgi:hypothetical protein